MISALNAKAERQRIAHRLQLCQLNAGSGHHFPRNTGHLGVGIFIGKINHLADARLYDRFCTFVAGEESNVEPCAVQSLTAGIEDRVQLCVNDEGILRLRGI